MARTLYIVTLLAGGDIDSIWEDSDAANDRLAALPPAHPGTITVVETETPLITGHWMLEAEGRAFEGDDEDDWREAALARFLSERAASAAAVQ